METKSLFIQQTPHLQLVTPEPLLIPACRGGVQASFAYMKDVFTGYMNHILKDQRFAKQQPPTKKTPAVVYEMYCNDRDLNDIYKSFGLHYELLSFESEEQIKMFVMRYRQWLATNNARTFFLCSEMGPLNKKELSPVSVSIDHRGYLKLYRHKNDNRVWSAKRKHRFVFPVSSLLIP
jgi:hypothetical protein